MFVKIPDEKKKEFRFMDKFSEREEFVLSVGQRSQLNAVPIKLH